MSDRIDDRDGQIGILKDRALFDVQLDKACDVVTGDLCDAGRIESAGAHCGADRGTSLIYHRFAILRARPPHNRARAPKASRGKPAAFFFTQAYQFQRAFRWAKGGHQGFQRH